MRRVLIGILIMGLIICITLAAVRSQRAAAKQRASCERAGAKVTGQWIFVRCVWDSEWSVQRSSMSASTIHKVDSDSLPFSDLH